MEHNPPSTYPIKATQHNPTATCPEPRPGSQMTGTSAKRNQTLETRHREISQRETRSFLTHGALAPPQLRSLECEGRLAGVTGVICVLCTEEKLKTCASSSVGVRGTGAEQPSPALLLTMEHKSTATERQRQACQGRR